MKVLLHLHNLSKIKSRKLVGIKVFLTIFAWWAGGPKTCESGFGSRSATLLERNIVYYTEQQIKKLCYVRFCAKYLNSRRHQIHKFIIVFIMYFCGQVRRNINAICDQRGEHLHLLQLHRGDVLPLLPLAHQVTWSSY